MEQSEIKRQIMQAYPYKIEMHSHTSPASSCGEVPAVKLPELYKQWGYDAVVLTNHFAYYNDDGDKEKFLTRYLKDYHDAKKRGEEIGVRILLGMELCFSEYRNDYLFYGVDESDVVRAYDYLYKGYQAFYTDFKTDKNLFLQAHPFRDNMQLRDLQYLDGIEVFNMHIAQNSRVAVAERFAEEHPGIVTTMGSDFHYEGQEGLSATRFKTLPKDSFELAALIRSGDYVYQIGEKIMF